MESSHLIDKFCRLCLKEHNDAFIIFDPDKSALNIATRIRAFSLAVAKNDDLPQKICTECRYKLEELYLFRQRSVLANKILRKHIDERKQFGEESCFFHMPTDEMEYPESVAFINEHKRLRAHGCGDKCKNELVQSLCNEIQKIKVNQRAEITDIVNKELEVPECWSHRTSHLVCELQIYLIDIMCRLLMALEATNMTEAEPKQIKLEPGSSELIQPLSKASSQQTQPSRTSCQSTQPRRTSSPKSVGKASPHQAQPSQTSSPEPQSSRASHAERPQQSKKQQSSQQKQPRRKSSPLSTTSSPELQQPVSKAHLSRLSSPEMLQPTNAMSSRQIHPSNQLTSRQTQPRRTLPPETLQQLKKLSNQQRHPNGTYSLEIQPIRTSSPQTQRTSAQQAQPIRTYSRLTEGSRRSSSETPQPSNTTTTSSEKTNSILDETSHSGNDNPDDLFEMVQAETGEIFVICDATPVGETKELKSVSKPEENCLPGDEECESGVNISKKKRKKEILRKFYCKICRMDCYTRAIFLQHAAAHRSFTKIVRKYRCDICHKEFTRPDSISRHKKIHTGERPHKCDLCGRAFIQKGSLTLHNRIHAKRGDFKIHTKQRQIQTKK